MLIRGVDTGELDLFPCGGGAGIAVVTGGDHDAGKDCEKHQPPPLLTDQATVTPLFR